MKRVGTAKGATKALTTSWTEDVGEFGCTPIPPAGWTLVGCSTRTVVRPPRGNVVYKVHNPTDKYLRLDYGYFEQNESEVETMTTLLNAGEACAVRCTLYRFSPTVTVVAMEYVAGTRAAYESKQVTNLARRLRKQYDIRDVTNPGNVIIDATGQLRLVDAGA